jgi:membrane protein
MPAGLQQLVKRVMALFPVRVVMLFSQKNGPLLANGLSFTALFSVFAALFVGFSIFGFALQGNAVLRIQVTGFLESLLPGLFGDDGLSIRELLSLNERFFDDSGVVAVVSAIIGALIAVNTALNWFGSFRIASRSLAGLEPPTVNIALLKVRDLLVVLGFGAALVVSFALLAVSTGLIETVLGFAGIGEDSFIAGTAARIVTLAVMLAFDTAVVWALFRIVSGFRAHWTNFFAGALLGAIGLEVLKFLGTALLGGASNNPLIATFAIPVGLLIFFNLVCQLLLVGASWVAVGIGDDEERKRRADAHQKAAPKLRRGGAVRWNGGPASGARPKRPALRSSAPRTEPAPAEPQGFWARLRDRLSR